VKMLAGVGSLATAECPIFNGGFGDAVPVREVVSQLKIALGVATGVRFTGISRRGDPSALVADPGRIAEAGIVSRVPLQSGLKNYADWFRKIRDDQ
jgi:UDP-glucose 4-epimerase